MLSQSTGGQALRLHSCRALSSQPQPYFTSKKIVIQTSPVDKPHTRPLAVKYFCPHLFAFPLRPLHCYLSNSSRLAQFFSIEFLLRHDLANHDLAFSPSVHSVSFC
jgi:hypothetical protein